MLHLKTPSENIISLQPVRLFIENNLHKRLTAKMLARKAGMSLTAFRNAFQKEYSCNVFAFAQQKRMEIAIKLLGDNNKPVKEIAALCGFRHTSHFTRAVKRTFKITPCQIRQQASVEK